MKKIISYSLWGNNERYTHGALRNSELASEIYPDWICRFYIGKSVPDDIIKSLKKKDNTQLILMNKPGDWYSMFWRFLPASDSNVDVMISRDCDSRLTVRERAAVEEWLKSDKLFHIMRDHPYHKTEILGGMWGVKKPLLSEMKEMIGKYRIGNFWQVDQNFLREKVYPMVKDHAMVHDEFFSNKPFPYTRDDKHFVGQAYSGDDKILDGDEYFIDRIKETIDASPR